MENLVIISLFAKLVVNNVLWLSGISLFLQAKKRKWASKTFTVCDNEVGPFLSRMVRILYHSTGAEVQIRQVLNP